MVIDPAEPLDTEPAYIPVSKLDRNVRSRAGRVTCRLLLTALTLVLAACGAPEDAEISPDSFSSAVPRSVLDRFAEGGDSHAVTDEEFRVSFPARPQRSSRQIDFGRSELPLVIHSLEIDGATFSAGAIKGDKPWPPERTLDGLVERFVGQEREGVETGTAELDGHPAVTFLIDDNKGWARGVLAVAGERIYRFMVTSDAEEPAGVDRFLSSVEIL